MSPASNPAIEEVAAEVKGKRRGRGRPPGPNYDAQKSARRRERRANRVEEPAGDERPPYVATEEGITVAAVLGNTLWNLTRIFSKHRGLNDEERQELGAALDPVLYKYIPVLDEWKAEATLVMVAWTLWERTKPPKDEAPAETPNPETNSKAEVVEEHE